MLERLEPIVKGLCVALLALLLFQVVRLAARSKPLAHLNIPALPTLPPETNAVASGAASNHLAATNSAKVATNTARTSVKAATGATNAQVAAGEGGTTNALRNAAQTSVNAAPGATNAPVTVEAAGTITNPAPPTSATAGTNPPALLAAQASAANSPAGLHSSKMDTNAVSGTNSAATNLAALPPGSAHHPPGSGPHMPPGMRGMPPGHSGRPGMSPLPELPLPIRARVYQVVDSEVLGPVLHPMPMALLGIAGDASFLRSASGQTGMVKEGDSLGGLKLLRIGINRVLVEDDGQQKELTIFSGYGGESLLPKEKDHSK